MPPIPGMQRFEGFEIALACSLSFTKDNNSLN
jgi:hypothetical protein